MCLKRKVGSKTLVVEFCCAAAFVVEAGGAAGEYGPGQRNPESLDCRRVALIALVASTSCLYFRATAPLRWVIERLLAKEATERYDSTRDLYRELRQVRAQIA